MQRFAFWYDDVSQHSCFYRTGDVIACRFVEFQKFQDKTPKLGGGPSVPIEVYNVE
jgi:hypothetical protein